MVMCPSDIQSLKIKLCTDLEAAGDGLHGDGAVRVPMRVRIHARGEGVAQRDRRRQHLDADEEVLVARRHRTRRGGDAVGVHYRGYHARFLEYGEAYTWNRMF